jgi:SAM-dependent methyltransferase
MSEHTCPVCSGHAAAISQPFVGFIEGYRTSIARCEPCDLHFSTCMDIPDGLYDRIYADPAHIYGYERYVRYAAEIVTQPDPLAYLARQELAYAFVADSLGVPAQSVVEVGCGLGYLTYALRHAGWACIGVDVSGVAVRRAQRRFGTGAFHEVGALESRRGTFDVAVALEAVEHVPDPVAFIQDCLAWVKPGGRLLISTPNKDAAPWGAIWASDRPPVHLTWLSRTALRRIAQAVGASVEFPAAPREFPVDQTYGRAVVQTTLDRDGKPYERGLRRLRRGGLRRTQRSLSPLLAAGHGPEPLPALRPIGESETLTAVLTRGV